MPDSSTDETKKSDLSRLEPNPKAKQEQQNPETANPVEPASSKPEPVVAVEDPKPTTIKKKIKTGKSEEEEGHLDLGAGYRIKYRSGSGYSVLYRLVAEHGNFATVAKDLERKTYDVHNKADASKLLKKILVPIDKLEEWCRADPVWASHAKKKTECLVSKAKSGDKKAKSILDNIRRCGEGKWHGDFNEAISTCVGYYNWLMKRNKKVKSTAKVAKPSKPNKNVKKFADAGVVFRRFPMGKGEDQAFVTIFPEKFIDQVKTAILVAKGVNEDA